MINSAFIVNFLEESGSGVNELSILDPIQNGTNPEYDATSATTS